MPTQATIRRVYAALVYMAERIANSIKGIAHKLPLYMCESHIWCSIYLTLPQLDAVHNRSTGLCTLLPASITNNRALVCDCYEGCYVREHAYRRTNYCYISRGGSRNLLWGSIPTYPPLPIKWGPGLTPGKFLKIYFAVGEF